MVTETCINGRNDLKALTLWDSGSNTTCFSPSYAYVAKLDVRRLAEPVPLQLGTVGSRSVINFGSYFRFDFPGATPMDYADIVNLDVYHLLIGTPTMHKYGVHLDFENNCVRIGSDRRALYPGRLPAVFSMAAPERAETSGYVDADIPRLRQAHLDAFADMMQGVPEELPPMREVNHEIHLADDNAQYQYYRPRCPDSLRDELRAKTARYLRAEWWK
ncbi:hypothetical protein CYLTODRAFT_354585, partial [Cylindrobasidium torrendii FP15055 ss-10]